MFRRTAFNPTNQDSDFEDEDEAYTVDINDISDPNYDDFEDDDEYKDTSGEEYDDSDGPDDDGDHDADDGQPQPSTSSGRTARPQYSRPSLRRIPPSLASHKEDIEEFRRMQARDPAPYAEYDSGAQDPDHLIYKTRTEEPAQRLGYRRAKCVCHHHCRTLLRFCADHDELLPGNFSESDDPEQFSEYRNHQRAPRWRNLRRQ